jgi:putative transposase
MVRNGVVPHPSSWAHGGYNEIQNPPLRYSLINREQLIACCGSTSDEQLRKEHRHWVEEAIHHNRVKGREPEWTDAIAVGSEAFVDEIRKKLQARQMGRKVREVKDHYELREPGAVYNAHFDPEKVLLSTENTYCLDLNVE